MPTLGLHHLPTFTLLTPTTLDEMIEMMESHPEAPIVAGGTNIIPSIMEKKIRPRELLDISRIEELRRLEVVDGLVRAGPLITHAQLAERFAENSDAFKDFIEKHTSPSITNIATLGGSLALKRSTEDLTTILLTHDTTLKIHSPSGVSEMTLEEFLGSSLDRYLISEIRFLDPTAVSAAFDKLSLGISYIPLVSAAVRLENGGRDRIICRVATSHRRGDVPGRVYEAEDIIQSKGLDETTILEAAKIVKSTVEPSTDLMAPSWFRRHVAAVLVKRLLRKLASR